MMGSVNSGGGANGGPSIATLQMRGINYAIDKVLYTTLLGILISLMIPASPSGLALKNLPLVSQFSLLSSQADRRSTPLLVLMG